MPAMGIPKRPELRSPATEYWRSFHVAPLSPVQCAKCAPDPTKDDRPKTKGRFLLTCNHLHHTRRESHSWWSAPLELDFVLSHKSSIKQDETMAYPCNVWPSDPENHPKHFQQAEILKQSIGTRWWWFCNSSHGSNHLKILYSLKQITDRNLAVCVNTGPTATRDKEYCK